MEQSGKFRKILLLLLLATALAGLGVFLFRVYYNAPPLPRVGATAARFAGASARRANFYKDPSVDISRIRVKMFYVVPKNKTQNPLWRETITSALDQVVKFQSVQFRGLSQIRYDIFPTPVLLRNEDSFYDTTSTNSGNPHGLVGVAQEIDERVFRVGGDFYNVDFAEFDKSEYPVMGLVYEGVGASGGVIYEAKLKTAKEIAEKLGVPESIVYIVDIGSVKGFFIINNQYLTADQYKIFGPTLLYHEFSHTIGLPDRFDDDDRPFSDDVTGSGRKESIDVTYIASDLLRDLGVIPD